MLIKLIIHPDKVKRIKVIENLLKDKSFKNPHPDLLYFTENDKLGVEQAKKIREHLSIKPIMTKGKALVLENAANLTLDAQNALLKTLEEPPDEALILLGTDNEFQLLPTILSRCEISYLEEERAENLEASKFNHDIEELLNNSVKERFEYIAKIEEREEFLKALIYFFREKLQKDQKFLEFTKELLQAEAWAKANVNIRGTLEYLMLIMP